MLLGSQHSYGGEDGSNASSTEGEDDPMPTVGQALFLRAVSQGCESEGEVPEMAETKASDGRTVATSGSRAAKTLPRAPYEGDPQALIELCYYK